MSLGVSLGAIGVAAALGGLAAGRRPDTRRAVEVRAPVNGAVAPGRQSSAGSLFDLGLRVVDIDGKERPLSTLKGHAFLATMFFASCPSVCPMLIFKLKQLESALPPGRLSNFRVLLVSFDPARDTPAVLANVVRGYGLDTRRWRVSGSTSEDDARALAAVLGIRYRSGAGGLIEHTTRVTVVDGQGRIHGAFDDPAAAGAALLKLVDEASKVLGKSPPQGQG